MPLLRAWADVKMKQRLHGLCAKRFLGICGRTIPDIDFPFTFAFTIGTMASCLQPMQPNTAMNVYFLCEAMYVVISTSFKLVSLQLLCQRCCFLGSVKGGYGYTGHGRG